MNSFLIFYIFLILSKKKQPHVFVDLQSMKAVLNVQLFN